MPASSRARVSSQPSSDLGPHDLAASQSHPGPANQSHPGEPRPSEPGSSGLDASRARQADALRTPLLERHRAAAARLVEFAGFEMPLHYPPRDSAAPVREEHIAVRERCGLFDVSHMGEIEVIGPGAEALLQLLLSNDIARMRAPTSPGRAGSPSDGAVTGAAQYSVLCRDDGGVLDDLIAYRLACSRFLVVTNAANHAHDLAWFGEHAEPFDVEVRDARERYAMLAVQGPAARNLVGPLADVALPPRMSVVTGSVSGVEALVCGTGYTGEDGLELLVSPDNAIKLWDELVAHGARPAGLAARDTLRIEACLPLYGNELSTARSPIAARLGWCCHEGTGFIGAQAVRVERQAGPAELLAAFRLDGPGVARASNRVAGGGEVTSGALSPCLGVGIGLAYVPAAQAALGTSLEIDVRGRARPATVVAKPFVTARADSPPLRQLGS